jgi:hypothetical protein
VVKVMSTPAPAELGTGDAPINRSGHGLRVSVAAGACASLDFVKRGGAHDARRAPVATPFEFRLWDVMMCHGE